MEDNYAAYNSSEVFVPAKQYGNTIHSDSLDIKRTERDARTIMPFFTSDHIFKRSLSFPAIHLNAQ